MRDFIFGLFVLGADRVQISTGNWTSVEEFKDDLDRLFYKNIGSLLSPVYLGESCDCPTGIPRDEGGHGPSMSEQFAERTSTR